MAVKVNNVLCPQNHACPAVLICPTGALTQTGKAAPEVVAELCTDCGQCAEFCPMGALEQATR